MSPFIRRDYRLSDADHARLIEASKPVMYLVANGSEPMSPRDAAMRIWREIADREGVAVESIRQGSDGNGHFTAVPKRVATNDVTPFKAHGTPVGGGK